MSADKPKAGAPVKILRKFTFSDYRFAHFVRDRMMENL